MIRRLKNIKNLKKEYEIRKPKIRVAVQRKQTKALQQILAFNKKKIYKGPITVCW